MLQEKIRDPSAALVLAKLPRGTTGACAGRCFKKMLFPEEAFLLSVWERAGCRMWRSLVGWFAGQGKTRRFCFLWHLDFRACHF